MHYRIHLNITSFVILALLQFQLTHAQDANNTNVIGDRQGNRWTIPLATLKEQSMKVPRVYASLRSAHFQGKPDQTVQIRPGVDHWEIRFKGEAASAEVVLEFDSYPALHNESKPIEQLGDGTLTLPSSLGRTHGQKLRFEPQPHKNTIGFWTKATDSVTWPITVAKPGEFNVGLLQGAGNGGGGTANISILKNDKSVASIDYDVHVTGHYQNFVWHHAGTVKIDEPGEYMLKIAAAKITKTALMDVRQVHLSPAAKSRKK